MTPGTSSRHQGHGFQAEKSTRFPTEWRRAGPQSRQATGNPRHTGDKERVPQDATGSEGKTSRRQRIRMLLGFSTEALEGKDKGQHL